MMKILSIMLICTVLSVPAARGANSASAFGGVGIDGEPRGDGTILVRQLVVGGPAHLAGIKAGDIITQVDGTQTAGSDFKFIVERRLRGRAGTPVLVVVRRPGKTKPMSFNLVRRQLLTGKKSKAKGE